MKSGASHNEAVLSCKTTQIQFQTTFLWGNFSPIATLSFIISWTEDVTCFSRSGFKMLHCSTSAKSWRLKRRNALLFPHHVGEHVSATLFISFIKRCCHCFQFTSSLMPHVKARKKKTKTARPKESKHLSQIEVVQISLNRCWNQWPEA